MKWTTSQNIHFDRVISAWLILRFIDPEATFEFSDELPGEVGTIAFGVPGADLGPHDEEGSTFAKIIDHYALDDEALGRIRLMVDATVKMALDGSIAAQSVRPNPLLALAEGIMAESPDDASCLSNSMALYDALYTGVSLRLAVCAIRPDASVRDCTVDITAKVRGYRESGGLPASGHDRALAARLNR